MGGRDEIEKALNIEIEKINRTELSWPQQRPGKADWVETPAKVDRGDEDWPKDGPTQPKDTPGE